jgi:hypothetical protein
MDSTTAAPVQPALWWRLDVEEAEYDSGMAALASGSGPELNQRWRRGNHNNPAMTQRKMWKNVVFLLVCLVTPIFSSLSAPFSPFLLPPPSPFCQTRRRRPSRSRRGCCCCTSSRRRRRRRPMRSWTRPRRRRLRRPRSGMGGGGVADDASKIMLLIIANIFVHSLIFNTNISRSSLGHAVTALFFRNF